MNDWKKKLEYKYTMKYSVEVPMKNGLKNLFQLAEEINTECGLIPEDALVLREDFDTVKQVDYNRMDARRVLAGEMSEEEYLNLHVSCICKKSEPMLMRGREGFPEFPGRIGGAQ